MVTIKAIGGLGNRMRVIDSAYQLVKNTNQSIFVIWEMSDDLNCSYFKLFEPVEKIEIKEYYRNYFLSKLNDLIRKVSKLVGINLPLGYDKYISDTEVLKALNSNTLQDLLPTSKDIYIRTVERFYYGPDSFSFLKPIKVLQDKIQSLNELFISNTVGVHIRRTDHILSIRHCPREAFLAQMTNEIEADPDVIFFLATDSIDEEQYFKKIFPDRIITNKKVFGRNSEKGIQDALIDLYCLANTRKIIGSYYSSFSEMAAQINGIGLNTIKVSTM